MHIRQRNSFPHIIARSMPLLLNADEVLLLQTLLDALMKHDCGTKEHAYRMVHWAVATAYHLQLPVQEVQQLRLATLLHDIGKIEVPQTLLCKAAPLTWDEWSIIRSHAEVGYRILQNKGGIFTAVAPLVLTHHERWNGSGYPLGLQKEEIPLAARILAVVDSFDAMTETRPYQVARTYNDACAELKKNAGVLYDPRVVNSFLAVVYAHTAMTETGPVNEISMAA